LPVPQVYEAWVSRYAMQDKRVKPEVEEVSGEEEALGLFIAQHEMDALCMYVEHVLGLT
jgi:hypothetical protein